MLRRFAHKGLVLLLSATPAVVIGCAGSTQQRAQMSTIDGRLNDMQRSLDLMNQRFENVQNDVMVLQDQMETTRIQVQKVELAASKPAGTVAPKRKELPPLIEIRSIETPRQVSANGSKGNENPLQLYKSAYGLYEANKLNDALEKFEEFVKANPSHDYADNAVYWMGECYYDQKEFMLAITEFKRVIKQYPASNKLADAWLKIGLCYERLDDSGEAARAYKSVQEQYPYTVAAKRAEERLNKLKLQ